MRQLRQNPSLLNPRSLFHFAAIPFLILLASKPVLSQSNERLGYVSTSIGAAFRLNGDAHPSGTQFNAVEVAYELRYGIGVVATFTVGNFNFVNGAWRISSEYNMVMLGPMYVMHLNRRSSIDIKARVGYHYHDEDGHYNDGSTAVNYSLNGAAVGFLITCAYQYRVADRWMLFGNLDLSTNQVHFAPQSAPSLTTLGVTGGVGFRF